ncbi:hypothetical protein GCM10023224_05320 [Streptomonospora halophila]|uniref:NTP pyrophosphohydrolase MazG-like domain-containing protein n=1 Tax=Streptomonospora halophila TaxID=427369 RepID=A0ABP9G5U5_9ACTN
MRTTPDRERAGRAIERRIDEMGWEYKEIADAARISVETLSRIRRGYAVAHRTYRKLEPALGWGAYAIDDLLAAPDAGVPEVMPGKRRPLPPTTARKSAPEGQPAADVVADLFKQMGIDGQSPRECVAHLCEEVGELAKATRTGDRTNLAEEVGDVGILLHRIAALYGVDVDQAIREKAASRLERHRGGES